MHTNIVKKYMFSFKNHFIFSRIMYKSVCYPSPYPKTQHNEHNISVIPLRPNKSSLWFKNSEFVSVSNSISARAWRQGYAGQRPFLPLTWRKGGGEGDGQPYHSNPTHRHVIYAHIPIPFSHTQPLENLKQETVTSVPIPFEENMTDTTNWPTGRRTNSNQKTDRRVHRKVTLSMSDFQLFYLYT